MVAALPPVANVGNENAMERFEGKVTVEVSRDPLPTAMEEPEAKG